MKIRLDPLDKLFARFIKLRDRYCQRCGGTGGLQTSHFWGRAKKSVRWDEENCCLLCMGCHMYFHSRPLEHTDFFKKRLGNIGFDMLNHRANQTYPKVDRKLVAIYFQRKIKELE